VAITGTGLAGVTGVSFGGVAATEFTVVSDGELLATSPPHAAAVVDVVVTTPAGATTAGPQTRFTYEAPEPTSCGTLTSDEVWTADAVHVLGCTVVIPDGVTLTLQPGVVVKSPGTYAFNVGDGGTLNVAGTAAAPVTITSYRDDSVGGDSNGDGTSTPQVGDYPAAVTAEPGATVSLSHAVIKWGSYGVMNLTNGVVKATAVTVADSEFHHGVAGLYLNNPNVEFDVRRSLFADLGQAVSLSNVDPSGFVLSGADSNRFAGSVSSRVVNVGSGWVPADVPGWSVRRLVQCCCRAMWRCTVSSRCSRGWW
jgi:hypothetical protein